MTITRGAYSGHRDPAGSPNVPRDTRAGRRRLAADCSAYPGYQVAFEQYSQDNSGNSSDGTLLCLEPVKH